MHLAMRPTPCTIGQVHLLVYYIVQVHFSSAVIKFCLIETLPRVHLR